jgi:GTP-binding protein
VSRPPARAAGAGGPVPVVAVVGRPNVGKSTLVNRVVGRRTAIVEEEPGVTRDRKELDAEWKGVAFRVVDTGGWSAQGDGLSRQVCRQVEVAVSQADLVLLVVDARVGVTEEDEAAARLVRRAGRPALVVANKVDSAAQEPDAWAAAALGMGEPQMVSALHGRGAGDLLDRVVERLGPGPAAPPAGPISAAIPAAIPAVAIVGRPNVGKSTLFNRLVGEERSVVHEVPGTTRDTVDTLVESPAGTLRFLDTAGLRRRSRVLGAEYFSMVRALQAIELADVALLVMDATEGVTHQDQRLAERVEATGSPLVMVLNKWELLGAQQRQEVVRDLEDRLGFLGYAPAVKVSALTGRGVHRILPAVREALDAYRTRLPTHRLNQVLSAAQQTHPPPAGARVTYALQGATDPPTLTLFARRPLPASYLRYLERRVREEFDLGPTPLKLRVRTRR